VQNRPPRLLKRPRRAAGRRAPRTSPMRRRRPGMPGADEVSSRGRLMSRAAKGPRDYCRLSGRRCVLSERVRGSITVRPKSSFMPLHAACSDARRRGAHARSTGIGTVCCSS
jgi:hypothetical protein